MRLHISVILIILFFNLIVSGFSEQDNRHEIYIPYQKLDKVFDKHEKGIFIPYDEFMELWDSASQARKELEKTPLPYLLDRADIKGKVVQKTAQLKLNLTGQVLKDSWVEIPIGFKGSAMSQNTLKSFPKNNHKPFLQIKNNIHFLHVHGPGRFEFEADYVISLKKDKGQQSFSFFTPHAPICQLDFELPEKQTQLKISPQLASQLKQNEGGPSRCLAFLPNSKEVKLSWTSNTTTHSNLKTLFNTQLEDHIHFSEGVIFRNINMNYHILRGATDQFSIHLPKGFKVTSLLGKNIQTWSVDNSDLLKPKLNLKLFSKIKGKHLYQLKLESFNKDNKYTFNLSPILPLHSLKNQGKLILSHSSRRNFHVKETDPQLRRISRNQISESYNNVKGVMAYQWLSSKYSAAIDVYTVEEKIQLKQLNYLGINTEKDTLLQRLNFDITRAGVFDIKMIWPNDWDITSIEPSEMIEKYELSKENENQILNISFSREMLGLFEIDITASRTVESDRKSIHFKPPQFIHKNLDEIPNELLLAADESFIIQSDQSKNITSLPLGRLLKSYRNQGVPISDKLNNLMAFEFIQHKQGSHHNLNFKSSLKETQVSATTHRSINITPASVHHETILQYKVQYAASDTFYVKVPKELNGVLGIFRPKRTKTSKSLDIIASPEGITFL